MTTTNQTTKKNAFTVDRIARIAIMAALMCVSSWITIPSPFNPAVPFTLQTFAVILAGLLLEPFEAGFAGIVYFLLGAVGLPIFSGFGNLYSRIFTATGGYLIGIFFTPFVISLVCKAISGAIDKINLSKAKKKTAHIVIYIAVAIVLGILVVDIPGVIQAKFITNTPWLQSIVIFALSFMPTDILKAVAAAVIALSLETPLSKIKK